MEFSTVSLESLPGFTPVVRRVRNANTNRQRIAAKLIKRTLSAKIKILNDIKNFSLHNEFYGLEPLSEKDLAYIQYLLAMLYQRRDQAKMYKTYVYQKQQKRKQEWLEEKRAKVYIKNHPFGEQSHDWLNYKIMKITGLSCGDGFDKAIDESSAPCCEFECCERLKQLGFTPQCLSPPTPKKVVKKRKQAFTMPKWQKFPEQHQPKERNQYLLWKLKAKILDLKNARLPRSKVVVPYHDFTKILLKRFHRDLPKVNHEGVNETDGAHGDSGGLTVDQASNVVLTRQAEESVGAPKSVSNNKTLHLASNDQHPQYDAFMDRFMLLRTVTWSTSKTQGEDLASYSLPYDIVKLRSETANMAFFKLYQYVQCDMEIKIQVNAQPMMQGQIQASWKYMDDFDQNVTWYNNIQSLSQTDHVLITANDENPGKLYIPYRYVKPSLSTTKRTDQDQPLRMGKLYLKVLNPLYTTATTCSDVDISIWVRFLNGKFSGMKSTNIGSIEHEGIWEDIKQAELHLNLDAKINNTDKPSVQTAQQPVIINSNQSYSAGTNTTEPINSLRLDMRGQCQNIESSENSMKISEIANVFGFVRTLKWHVCDTSGTLLTRIDASPMFNLNEYAQGVEKTENYYNLPPVAVLSEMFLYWRGSLELRMDVIATAFHKGKLMVCYVPRTLDNITMAQALGCPHAIFDLSQQKQFSFIVPWITNQHYWSRRYGVRDSDDEVQPPGRIHIFIQNKLSKMENVKDSVDINLYWRGGKDFSVAVPATSALSLPWNAAKSSSGAEFKAGPGYAPFYVGQWRYFYGNRPILRYGTGADHVAQFINVPEKIDDKIYTYDKKDGQLTAYVKNAAGTDWELQEFSYGVIIADDSYRYMGMCRNLDEAKKYLNYQKYPTEYKVNTGADAMAIIDDDDRGSWGGKNNLTWKEIVYTPQKPTEYKKFEIVYHEGEKDQVESPSVVLTEGNVFIPNATNATFGENFDDLKDLCRRYQPYCPITLTTNKYAAPVDKIMPIAPCGLSLGDIDGTKSADKYKYLKREGHIPLICSAYRFFRGSLRFRLPLAHSEAQIFMTHLPEKQGLKNIESPKADSFDAYYSPTYASYVQSTHVNPVVSIEIPFYNPNNSIFPNWLNTTALKEMSGLLDMGALAVGASSQAAQIATSEGVLFYSFGDDAQLSCFQGFPSLILRKVGIKKVNHEGFLDFWNWKPTIKVDIGLKDVLESPQFASLQETMKSFGVSTSQVILNQIIHVAINPTLPTISWAITSLLINLKIFSFDYFEKLVPIFDKLTTTLSNFIIKSCNSNQPDNKGRGLDIVNHEALDDQTIAEIGSIIATLFSVLTICMNCKAKAPSNLFKYIAVLVAGVAAAGKSYQSVLNLFINVLKLIRKLGDYISMRLYPEKLLEKLVNEETPILQLWTDEALELINIENEDRVYTVGSIWAQRMEVCYLLGCRILKSVNDYTGEAISRPQLQVFQNLFKQVCEKRDQMYRRGRSVVARRDPFCIYISGPPGIGKSILATKFVSSLLRDAGVPVPGEAIFTLPNGAKYWNGCRNQPAILIDDFLSINTGTIQEEAIRAFMEIKSAAVLNPPMAAISEKDLRYAPEMLMVLANEAFPVVNHANLEAIYRRRDILLHVDINDELKEAGLTRISDQTKEELETQFNISMNRFEHLNFKLAGDVTGGIAHLGHASLDGAQFGRNLTYEEMYRRVLVRFDEHRINQEDLFQMRVDILNDFWDDEDIDMATLQDKLTEFRNIIHLMGMLPIKEHASYKDYLRLIQMAVRHEPISELKIREVVEIRENILQNFQAWQNAQNEIINEAMREAPNVEREAEEQVEHEAPHTWTGAYSVIDAEKKFKHKLQYSIENKLAYYSKSVKVTYKHKKSNQIKTKYIPVAANLQYEAVLGSLVHRFQLLKGINYNVLDNMQEITLELNEQVTAEQFLNDLPKINLTLREKNLPEYKPIYINVNRGINDPPHNPADVEAETCNLFVSIFHGVVNDTDYRETFSKFLDESTYQMDPSFKSLIKTISGGTDQRVFNKFLLLSNLYLSKYVDTEYAFKKFFPLNRYNIKTLWADLALLTCVWIVESVVEYSHFMNYWRENGEAINEPIDIETTFANVKKSFEALCGHMPSGSEDVSKVYSFMQDWVQEVKDCPHLYFGPASMFSNEKWSCTVEDIFQSKIIQVPDRVCESPNCMWKRPFLLRYHAQLWKVSNPTQFNILMKSTNPPYLFTKPSSIDPTFWEKIKMSMAKGWMWVKLIASIACMILLVILILLLPVIILLFKLWLAFKVGSFISGLFGGEETETFSQYATTRLVVGAAQNVFHHGYADNAKGSANPKSNHFNKFFTSSKHQAGELNPINQLYDHIFKNTFWVQDIRGGSQFRITGLGNNVYIFLKHYWEYFRSRKTETLLFKRCCDVNQIYNIQFDEIQFTFTDHNSTGLAKLPNSQIPLLKVLYRRFQPMRQLRSTPKLAQFLEISIDNKIIHPINLNRKEGVIVSAQGCFSEQILSDIYEYNYGGPGCCGSFIIDPVQMQILGVHVAGSNGMGYGEVFSSDSFAEFFKIEAPKECEVPFVNPLKKTTLSGDFVYLGRVEDGLGHHQSSQSQIQKTLIHGVTPVFREPAPLGKCDPRVPIDNYSPLKAGVEKMLQPPKNFPDEVLEKAKEDLNTQILTKLDPIYLPIQPLSYFEAIRGIPGMQYYDSLDMTTSEGFPLSRFRPGNASNKSWLFDVSQEDEIGIHPKLLQLLDADIHNRLNNKQNAIVHDDCLKDALIPKSKIAKPGKTRVFSVSPVQFTIQFKQYFNHFLAAFKAQRIKLEHAIGINANSFEWGMLVRYLREVGTDIVVTGDYSNFGPALNIECVRASFDIIINWLNKYYENNPTYNRIMVVMKHELCNAMHLAGDQLFMVKCGLPSGNPATVEMNSMVNMLYIRCAWIEIMSKTKNYNYFMDHYYIHVRLCTYGDDLIMSVTKEISELFNSQTLSDYFAKYNIIYTDATKSGEVKKYDALENSQFLKRSFKKHPKLEGQWLAPLDWDCVLDTPNWCKRFLSLEDGTRESVCAALAEAYGHGPELYEELRSTLLNALIQEKIACSLRTWDDWDLIHFSEFKR